MDIHEYQAKQLLSKFGVNIPPGEVVYQTHEAENILSWLNEDKIVVKAQVHAGGRGKAGGVKVCKGDEEVVTTVDKMIGMNIITPQTNESGKIVRRVYLEKAYNIEKEFYFCITVDRETGGNTIVYSKKGGVNIEEVAEKTPKKYINLKFHPEEIYLLTTLEQLFIIWVYLGKLQRVHKKIFFQFIKHLHLWMQP